MNAMSAPVEIARQARIDAKAATACTSQARRLADLGEQDARSARQASAIAQGSGDADQAEAHALEARKAAADADRQAARCLDWTAKIEEWMAQAADAALSDIAAASDAQEVEDFWIASKQMATAATLASDFAARHANIAAETARQASVMAAVRKAEAEAAARREEEEAQARLCAAWDKDQAETATKAAIVAQKAARYAVFELQNASIELGRAKAVAAAKDAPISTHGKYETAKNVVIAAALLLFEAEEANEEALNKEDRMWAIVGTSKPSRK